jgi:phosphoglycolate phosphatase
MLSNILFDLDGTLTDPKDGITRCIQFSLDQLGVTPPRADQLTWCIGPPLRGSFSHLLNTLDNALLDQALSHYRKRFSETGMYENAIYPEITPALRKIRTAGFRVFLATSKPSVYARKILDHFDLTQFFHAIHGSELDGRLSDKGELVAHILDSENLKPQATLIVGDRSQDIIGGKKNGIVTAAVTYGYGSREEITASKPDYVFESPSDLAAFLESNIAPNKLVHRTRQNCPPHR